MKTGTFFFAILFIVSCANGKEKNYTGSTPAAKVIRSFLGISLTDSIDFIRWKLMFTDNKYTLSCNYGIGKPNTNGFMEGGKKVELQGDLKKEKNVYRLMNGSMVLKMMELNSDLLHLLNTDNTLLAGNGGWSYTLANINPLIDDKVSITAQKTILKDSMSFEGRTPCAVPGVIAEGKQCYKLKWYMVLHADAKRNEPTTYKLYGTPYRNEGGRKGNWKIITGNDGRIIYQLNDDSGNGFLYLLKLDEHILVFTDAAGKLLAGNEDFSYTLNRRF
ncbi:MAG TPA: hypothetical protein PLA68_04765 [Panacibacter sp.]|nr:hypothetical protein [Panacibacter sp.]